MKKKSDNIEIKTSTSFLCRVPIFEQISNKANLREKKLIFNLWLQYKSIDWFLDDEEHWPLMG